MRAFATTDFGIEDIAAQEIEEKGGTNCREGTASVGFEANFNDLCTLTYKCQSLRRVCAFIAEFKKLDFSIDFDWEDWLDENTSFRVTCDRERDDFDSRSAEKKIGGMVMKSVKEQLGFEPEVDLENPDLIIYCHVADKGLVGIDFAGKDLTQRDYKLYSHPTSFRGSIGYALLRMAGFEKGVLLDPFCGAAVIPLEAAHLASRVSVHYQNPDLAFMKLKQFRDRKKWLKEANKGASMDGFAIHAFDNNANNLKYGKDNAALDRMDMISFSRTDVEWLDTNLNEESVDFIVTHPPQDSNHKDSKQLAKIYDELFYQSKYVLKGPLVALMLHTGLFLKAANKHGFEMVEEREITTGQLVYKVLRIEKV